MHYSQKTMDRDKKNSVLNLLVWQEVYNALLLDKKKAISIDNICYKLDPLFIYYIIE